MAHAVCQQFLKAVAHKPALVVGQGHVVYVVANLDVRAVHSACNGLLQLVFERNRAVPACQKVHALPHLVERVLGLDICRDHLCLGLLGVAVYEQFCRLRLHYYRRYGMPRVVVNVARYPVALLIYRRLRQFAVCLLEAALVFLRLPEGIYEL